MLPVPAHFKNTIIVVHYIKNTGMDHHGPARLQHGTGWHRVCTLLYFTDHFSVVPRQHPQHRTDCSTCQAIFISQTHPSIIQLY